MSGIRAKRFYILYTKKFRQTRIVAKFGVLIKRQVNPIERKVMIQKEFDPLPVVPLKPQGDSPKKPVVNEDHPGPGIRGAPKDFEAGVYGKGYFPDFSPIVIHLEPVKRRVRGFKFLYIQ
jgi:hypothetical protein